MRPHQREPHRSRSAAPAAAAPVRQDEDVLDTWFSSWLVPFSSLGWPDQHRGSRDVLSRPHAGVRPRDPVLLGGPDDHVGAPLHGRGAVHPHLPARHRAGHPAPQDVQVAGQRDRPAGGGRALRRRRAALLAGLRACRSGTDVILDPDDLETSFAAGRNFANKLWNAGRFILSNLDGPPRPLAGGTGGGAAATSSPWRTAGSSRAATPPSREATEAYERFRLNEAAAAVYRFIWSDLADWYIEQIKPRLYGDVPGGDVARAVAAQTFDVALRLLHPVMPFVTEALWRRFPGRPAEASISVAPWPRPDPRAEDAGGARANSGWCRSWWAPSAASAPSMACSPARRCGRW